jgi:hypothetical protein
LDGSHDASRQNSKLDLYSKGYFERKKVSSRILRFLRLITSHKGWQKKMAEKAKSPQNDQNTPGTRKQPRVMLKLASGH